MSSPYGPKECAVGTFSAFPHGVIGGPERNQKAVPWMAYTDAEVEEVRIVMTIYTDARLAGKKGRHPKAMEPMDFLPQRKKRKGRDRKVKEPKSRRTEKAAMPAALKKRKAVVPAAPRSSKSGPAKKRKHKNKQNK